MGADRLQDDYRDSPFQDTSMDPWSHLASIKAGPPPIVPATIESDTTKMTRKKGSKARDATNIKENINASKAKPVPVKGVPLKNNKPTGPPKEKGGLLVTAELEKAIEECKTKVAQIVKGCRASNRKYR